MHNNSKVQWYRNNQLLEENENCVIETDNGKSTIRISDANRNKIGKYEVVVESDNKIVKSASSVKLQKLIEEEEVKAPVFIKLIHPMEVCIGDIVLIQTEVVSSPPASFQWFIGNKEVKQLTKENKLNTIYVSTKSNVSCLCIENITEDIVGMITCRAENFAGSVSCSASLTILKERKSSIGTSPSVVSPLNSLTVMDGETISLLCEISGQPWPTISWFRDNNPIVRDRDVVFSRQESGLCELCIKEAFPEMMGTYRCTATNEFGSCATECYVTVEGRADKRVKCMTLFLFPSGMLIPLFVNARFHFSLAMHLYYTMTTNTTE